jgi:3'-phosphoadenosine 5'-phosphosulfate sulfotransferase (PAPS reductase)/FAD synthetase
MTLRVVHFSGGTGSYATAKRVAERYGTESLVLLFADTNYEDPDLYRFLFEAAADVGGELVRIGNDGKTIWDVMREHRYIGNTRLDPCSYYLKRMPLRRWLEEFCDPEDTVSYLGIDWSESHRFERAAKYWAPWTVESPLLDPPYLDKDQINAQLLAAGIQPPALTREGFPHNNCKGGCVKAGMGSFLHLLKTRPETFAEWERNENELRELLGDVAILRDRRNKTVKPLPLTVLRQRAVEKDPTLDEFDFGGCACATGSIEEDEALREALAKVTVPAK